MEDNSFAQCLTRCTVNSVHYCTDAHLHSAVKYYLLNEAEHNTLVTEHLIEHSYTQRRDAKPPSAPNQ
jgi:hypothetical protein